MDSWCNLRNAVKTSSSSQYCSIIRSVEVYVESSMIRTELQFFLSKKKFIGMKMADVAQKIIITIIINFFF